MPGKLFSQHSLRSAPSLVTAAHATRSFSGALPGARDAGTRRAGRDAQRAAALAIMRTKARTFAFASSFLPPGERFATASLYAFFRTVDDLVDEPLSGLTCDERRAELAVWQQWLRAWPGGRRPSHPLAEPLDLVLRERKIPVLYLLLLLDGVSSDLQPREVATWVELRTYCFLVASTVGLAMCHVLGVGEDSGALRAAAELGVAMQLTNILRDVGADLRDGRLYLPADEMAAYRYSRERLRALENRLRSEGRRAMDDDFRQLMDDQIRRARGYYVRGLAGVARLPAPHQLPIFVAGRLYGGILDEIERSDYDVLTRRVATSRARKVTEAARCWLELRSTRFSAPPVALPAFRLEDWTANASHGR